MSNDTRVQQFLEDIRSSDLDKYNILQKLREIVFAECPDVSERMMYGGIMFSLEKDFGGLFVYTNHVSFEFSNGAKMNDPKILLEGQGKFRRHLKFISSDDIDTEEVAFFVQQAR